MKIVIEGSRELEEFYGVLNPKFKKEILELRRDKQVALESIKRANDSANDLAVMLATTRQVIITIAGLVGFTDNPAWNIDQSAKMLYNHIARMKISKEENTG